jgi:outer membrane protein OmpA-like peptidoglycan-associated protein
MMTQAEADSIARVDVAWQRSPLAVETITVRDTLTSAADRITDDVIRDDLALLELWADRIDELPTDSTPDALYARTRAAELLELATNEYTDNDRSSFPNALVSDVKATVEHLERHETPTWNDVLDGSTRVAPDAWTLVADIKADSARFACVAEDLARLEAALLWAGNEELTCTADDPRPLLQRALALADSVRISADACTSVTQHLPTEPVVEPQPVEPEPEVVPEPEPKPVPAAQPVRASEPQPEPEATAEAEVPVGPLFTVSTVVHFALDRADVQGLSIAVLDSVAHVLHLFPDMRVEIVGYTDTRGDRQYNAILGQRRADAVKQFLMDLGVTADRMDVRSDGELNRFVPIAQSDRDHALNRRVEIYFRSPQHLPIQPRHQERDLKHWLEALVIEKRRDVKRSR